ncbi:hypothetical protein FHS41_008243 [Streptomyces violarus]|uniref:Uncharacterized protein n=1 Tax=Streptomyces violarus TaxID=67380 RepID=A0A7W4ZZV6_9ACTN|nr:hypothetical protein [Streptomyces violarus]MBB3081685.1 hypothetical protein [Streptomyces violarus]
MFGICYHPGEHTIVLAPGESLPKPGAAATRCADRCARCRQQVRNERHEDL